LTVRLNDVVWTSDPSAAVTVTEDVPAGVGDWKFTVADPTFVGSAAEVAVTVALGPGAVAGAV
jgi:hypothetical protein